jgi:hypothetical protein
LCLPELPPQAIGWWILAGLVGLAAIGQALARQSIGQSRGLFHPGGPVAERLGHFVSQIGIDLAPVFADARGHVRFEARPIAGVTNVNRPGNCGDSFAWKGKSNVYTEEEANPAGEEATAVCFPAEVSA